jgi:4-hydroxy-tetrahydrodipicolinate synthase
MLFRAWDQEEDHLYPAFLVHSYRNGRAPHRAKNKKDNSMKPLAGVFAAAATPLRSDASIDHKRLVRHCRWLLNEGGCDGVNLLGTTGEATSFSVEERLGAMRAVAGAGLPLDRFMAGTGAAALEDAIRLTAGARDLGFAGALLLPPFYYKALDDESLMAYVAEVIRRACGGGLGLYLYHIPPVSMVPYPIAVVEKLARTFPDVIAGIKDSSGELAHTLELVKRVPQIAVFPGAETNLGKAPDAGFAGCISATTNVNGAIVSRGWRTRNASRGLADLAAAAAIRETIAKVPVIAAVKWILAELQDDPEWRRVRLPLRGLGEEEWGALRAALAPAGLFRGMP